MSHKRRTFLRNTVLASLSLGAISKVSAESTKKTDVVTCDQTTKDFYGTGPFYTENPPMLNNNLLADADEPGERMIISGRVLNLDCNQFIPDTIVDVWHANDGGQYDNDSYNLRGFTKTNEQGFYLFETIKPGKYLNGGTFRPAHIHYKITPPEFPQLTTQLYFEGDTSISGDAAASITNGEFDATNRIIPLTENAEGILEGTFDIVIDGSGIAVGVQDLHLENGMIYEVFPNPMKDELKIHYGVFRKSRVGIVVYDMMGKQVAVLEDSEKTPEKYYAYWKPDTSLPSGHYFVAIRINDLQVHYVKVFR